MAMHNSKTRIGVVCGLKSEAEAVDRSLRGAGLDRTVVELGISGANANRAAEIAERLSDGGVSALISVGVSGALKPGLEPGDLIVSSKVTAAKGQGWARIRAKAAEVQGFEAPDADGVLLGADLIVQTPNEKSALYRETGAVAVDMESHAVARVAEACDLPFLAARAIADPADRALPEAAMDAVAEDGSTRVVATLLKCAKAPGQFPALLQLGADSEKALKTLRRDLGLIFRGLLLSLDL